MYRGMFYTRTVEPLLEKRIRRYLTDMDKEGICRCSIVEVRERLEADGFKTNEIEHGIVEALYQEYLVV